MHVIEANNVRDALVLTASYLLAHGQFEDTRIGSALVAQEPVCIHYLNPKQHVLLNPIRDANPFFHLMEAMWMLAGRDDGAFLDFYVKDFSKRFGKDGVIMDSYGQRWRHGLHYDQLNEVVNQLRKDPTTRQVVLQMWGAGRDDLRSYSSKPCNLIASYRILFDRLNMTVFNRSNDLIWGACGANAVHFPILQEYLAGKIGVELGEYWQVTNNLHMYSDVWEKHPGFNDVNPEEYGTTMPLIENPLKFDEDLAIVMRIIDELHNETFEVDLGFVHNPFLRDVVLPMATAHQAYKNKDFEKAFEYMDVVAADDWKRAGREWLERRHAG